jgi:signal transduction histidine kinase
MGHALRVAAVTTALIAVVYVAAAAVLDVIVVDRLTHQVDQRLTTFLADPRPSSAVEPGASASTGSARPRDLDDAPLLLWRVAPTGSARAVSSGAPALPRRSWSSLQPLTATLAGRSFRFEARSDGAGWLVAAQSLAERDHLRGLLLGAEGVVAPVILVAVYLGALTIGVKAAAPVERTRRRQLEFTADASHELRTPLAVIEAEVGLALSSPRSADYYRATLERVGGESRRLRQIVEDLLWLARFDSQPPPPRDRPVDLEPLVNACADRFRALAGALGVDLAVRSDGASPPLIEAPPEWVDRLIGVLVDNACRYSPPGGTVTLTVGGSGARAHVVVEDDGPGIPPEERDRLFDRFHRASDRPGGAGLGLAIADAVVRSTGGRWRIGSSASGGARMEVSWHRAGGAERRPDEGRLGDQPPTPNPVEAR